MDPITSTVLATHRVRGSFFRFEGSRVSLQSLIQTHERYSGGSFYGRDQGLARPIRECGFFGRIDAARTPPLTRRTG